MDITINSSKDEKVRYLGDLVNLRQKDEGKEERLKKEVDDQVNSIMKKTIGQTRPYVPKANLTYDEFLAIKSTFKNQDFNWTSQTSQTVLFSHLALILIGKILLRMKKL